MMAIATIGHDGYAAADGQDVSATITARDDVDERGRYEAVSPLAATQRDAADADDIVHIDADERALVAVGTTAMAATADHPAYETDWIIDSGASHHMTGNVHALTDIHATGPVSITVASGLKTVATTAGTARVTLDTGMGPKSTVLRDVLLAPGLAVNLFSIKSIMTHGCLAFFSNGGVTVNTKENVCFQGRTRGYVLVLPLANSNMTPLPQSTDGGAAAAAVGTKMWHNRLAHPGREAMLRTQAQVDGMDVSEATPRAALADLCEPCVLGKQTRGSFPTSTTETTAAMDLLHMDLCGPLPVTSTGGANYLLGIVDDKSNNAAVVPIRLKSQAGAAEQRRLRRGRPRWDDRQRCIARTAERSSRTVAWTSGRPRRASSTR